MHRERIWIRGVVQGIGFRPFVWRLAQECKICGYVCNDATGVLIEATADSRTKMDAFCQQIVLRAPAIAVIASLERQINSDTAADEVIGFQITASQRGHDASAGVPADLDVCEDCLRELDDPNNRRFGYPFINCTHCGPRFTLIQQLPYDRAHTTMSKFVMCRACQSEYDDPTSRRFHAQPNACLDCGPSVWFVESGASSHSDQRRASAQAIAEVRTCIQAGQIIAIRGVGGFHLACDASSLDAVACLRERKQRPDKPFAVMVRDLATVRSIAKPDDAELGLLESRAKPIVLLDRSHHSALTPSVYREQATVGVMLAHSPLHMQLIRGGEVWVMTSANVSDEPIAFDNADAWNRLKCIADGFLFHDREIETPCDDSVIRVFGQGMLPIRRSRGYTPLPIPLPYSTADQGDVLAVGGELKATLCVLKGKNAFLGQHLGDVQNRETFDALTRSARHLSRLYRCRYKTVVADEHPGYLSRDWAQRYASEQDACFVTVQHHHAHVASLMTEHGLAPEQALLGVCFDGTGYGSDGAIWGGEWLLATGHGFRRSAHLNNFRLPGGDACIRHPARIALSLMHDAGISTEGLEITQRMKPVELQLLEQQLSKNLHCVPSSSVGRLFDAVAALCGMRQTVTFEGQAAMWLEAIAEAWFRENSDAGVYPFEIIEFDSLRVDWRPWISAIMDDVRNHVDHRKISARFHQTMAEMIGEVCDRLGQFESDGSVGLTGGVFQNTLLTGLTIKRLESSGWHVLTHRIVPPNDGGLALGQAYLARFISFP